MSKKSWIGLVVLVLVLSAITGGIVVKIEWPKIQQHRRAAMFKELKTVIWPRESKLKMAEVQSRQAADLTSGAVTIDLSPFINAKLTDAPICWKGNNADNLRELPEGKNIYAGVPFEVEGSIQLMGKWLEHYSKTYPEKVENIPIGRRCKKLHILHGAAYVTMTNFGVVSSEFVLDYADGTTRELNMVNGAQVFDWWYPLFTTRLPPAFTNYAPGTELAWTGSNPYIKKWQPDTYLALFKTTFDNPQPDIEIASVDYVSKVTMVCPMLLGLTVE